VLLHLQRFAKSRERLLCRDEACVVSRRQLEVQHVLLSETGAVSVSRQSLKELSVWHS